MASRLTVSLLCALLLAVGAGWARAHADDPPLMLSLEADSEVCTAGSLTEVRWEIGGGAEPYEATLNGQPVDAPSGATTVACGAALDVPDWLRSVVPLSPIDVELVVGDAGGAAARGSLRLNRAPPLPVPIVDGGPGGAHTFRTTIIAHARGVGVGVEHVRRYLVRWRADETAQWNYHTDTAQPHSGRYDQVLYHETGAIGARVAVEVAQVRSFAEREKPDLLNWSEAAYATTVSPPTDLTARATHDTITVSWDPDVAGLVWTVTVSSTTGREEDRRRFGNSRSKWTEKTAGPALPYEVSYSELLPDTLYHVRVEHDDGCFPYGYDDELCAPARGLSVRTAPAPPGWSQESRRPQSVKVTARGGGPAGNLAVAWEPPVEGSERRYDVFVYEYGAPPEAVTPAGGVGGRQFHVSRRLDTTYEVVVRHLGIEDEEARTMWVPEQAASGRSRYMKLPNWHVEHREPAYDDHSPGYEFAVTWDTEHEGDSVQVRWLKDGYEMTRSSQDPPILIRMAEPGPHPFQLRLRDESGYWSPWSSIRRASAKPPPPWRVDVRERKGMLVVSWAAPTYGWGYGRPADHLGDRIDGYRVYLYRTGEPDRMLDVGPATSAEFPIPADGGEYQVHITAYSDKLGEGQAVAETFSQADGPLLTFADPTGVVTRPWCTPSQGRPAIISWQVQGGAAPYTINVGNAPAFETTDHAGYMTLECDPHDTRDETTVGATVTDAWGRTGGATAWLQIAHPSGDAARPASAEAYWRGRVEGLALGRIHVEDDSFVLRWNRYVGQPHDVPSDPIRRHPLFLVRWREVGAEPWRYRTADDAQQNDCGGRSSRWTLQGLTPDTEYEVQVALDPTTIGIVSEEPLDWSESRTARTLPDMIHPTLWRRGADVVVSWPSITEAQDYRVTLEGGSANWSKAYEPQGGAVEEAVFVDVPAELMLGLRAEVTTKQGISADPGGMELEDDRYWCE